MFNTGLYVTDKLSAADALDEIVAEGGILAADFRIKGWNVERRFMRRIQDYGNSGRPYTTTLLSRKPI